MRIWTQWLVALVGPALLAAVPPEAASAATVTPGVCAPVTPSAGPPFNYEAIGIQFLAKLQSDFWDPSTATYFETLACSSGEHGKSAYLWTEGHAIGALYWASLVDPVDFKPLLAQAIVGTSAYARTFTDSKGTWTAHAVARGAKQIDFDDNALLGTILTRVFLNSLPDKAIQTESLQSIDFVYGHRQTGLGNGVPQVYADPLPSQDVGIFYAAPTLGISRSFVQYGMAANDDASIDIGVTYIDEVISPALGLLHSNGLFTGSTRYDPTTMAWTAAKVGELGSESTSVASLALDLYHARGDRAWLGFAETLMPEILEQWYAPGVGVNQVSVWGGQGIVDILCQLYLTDHNVVWYNDAKDIIDFLLAHGRDTAGFFANSTTSAGKWNVVRTGQAPDATVTLLTQATAAAAILEFAGIDRVYQARNGR